MFIWLRVLVSRIRGWFSIRRLDQDFEQELDLHLAMLTEENIHRGMPAAEASRAARLRLGGLTQLQENYHELRSLPFFETLFQDVRFAIRALRRHFGFTMGAVSILALGISANTAIFSVVDAVLFRPLPYRDSEQLVKIGETTLYQGTESGVYVSVQDFLDWRDTARSFETMTAGMPGGMGPTPGGFPMDAFTMTGGSTPEKIQGASVLPNFFSTLGVSPKLGRLFTPTDGGVGHDREVVLGYHVWQTSFGSDPHIIGRTIELSDAAYTVIGILPESFEFSWGYTPIYKHSYDIWVPLDLHNPTFANREVHPLFVIGRLNPGASISQARSEMDLIGRRLASKYPGTNSLIRASVISFQDQVVHNVRPEFLVLLSGVVIVLLIGCTNVANLFLIHGARRRKEVSIRVAVGANRFRIFRQFVTESMVIAFVSGLIGLALSFVLIHLLLGVVPSDIPRLGSVQIDSGVIAFTALVSMLTGIMFGVFPALHFSRINPTDGLKETSGANLGLAKGSRWSSDLLVVSEVVMTVVLVVSAGLLVESLWRLRNVELGFAPSHLLTTKVSLPESRYRNDVDYRAFEQRMISQSRSTPGSLSVAVASSMPFSALDNRATFSPTGSSVQSDGEEPEGDYSAVSDSYFTTTDIGGFRGRYFSSADSFQSRPVVIINDVIAHQLWPNEDPVGRYLNVTSMSGLVSREIVGVVESVRTHSPTEAPGFQMYVPYTQDPSGTMYLLIRTASSPEDIARSVRLGIMAIDKNLPVEDMMTMQQRLASFAVQPRFYTSVLSLFAMLALVLASAGIYAVVSYSVARRTREIGLRIALGAQARDILRIVVGRAMILCVIGVGIGLIGTLATSRVLSSLLYGVRPSDAVTYILVGFLVVTVVGTAAYIPARRALRIDPLTALRYE